MRHLWAEKMEQDYKQQWWLINLSSIFVRSLSFNVLLCFYNCSALKILSYQKTFKAQKKNIGRLMPGFFFSFFSSMLKRLLLFAYQMSVLLTLLFFLANKILFIFFVCLLDIFSDKILYFLAFFVHKSVQ